LNEISLEKIVEMIFEEHRYYNGQSIDIG